MNQIKRFFQPILVEPKYIFKLSFFRILQWFTGVFNIFMVKDIISLLENKDISQIHEYIFWYGSINIILFIGIFVCRNWSWWEVTHYIFKMIHRIYFPQLNQLDNTYLENIGTGKIISIYSKWAWTWVSFLLDTFEVVIKLIFSLWASVLLLYTLGSVAITLFFLIFIFVHILIFLLNKKAKYWRKWRVDMMNEYDRQIVKIVMSKFEILQNNKIQREIKILDRCTDEAKYYNLHLNNYLMTMLNIPNIVFFIFTIALLISFTKIEISFATMISIFMILSLLKENMYQSVNFFKNFTKDIYQIQKLWELFDNWSKISWLNIGKDFEYKWGNVLLQNISFSYWENSVFKDFSLSLAWWKKIAFVWASWWGKTTLVKIISWFLSSESWEIVIDGQKLSEINLLSYYKHIWYLTQEPSVFDGSIKENLLYGMWEEKDIQEEWKIHQAILDAKCEFIYDFKEWLETQIWERWVRLSGWQKQRLAIAKLFLKNPEIIILDEPTSALDSFSEEAIRESFEKLFVWKTVFIIAHRLQTVKTADDIIVFEWWKVIERGNHEELLWQNWYYKKMLELQSGF